MYATRGRPCHDERRCHGSRASATNRARSPFSRRFATHGASAPTCSSAPSGNHANDRATEHSRRTASRGAGPRRKCLRPGPASGSRRRARPIPSSPLGGRSFCEPRIPSERYRNSAAIGQLDDQRLVGDADLLCRRRLGRHARNEHTPRWRTRQPRNRTHLGQSRGWCDNRRWVLR
jgi:hypothetical protein